MMHHDHKNIAVIIPAHNEEDALPKVLEDIPKGIVRKIIVVDNASTDQTAEIAKSHNCQVFAEPKRGYGRACLKGIAHLPADTDIVVFLDGDHSDHPEQLPDLLKPIIHDGYDFVIGSRALGQREKGAMTPQAYWGNKLACALMKLFWGVSYSDLGPFRVITYSALKQLRMNDQDFGWTIEMQIKAVEVGLKVKEVSVNYRKRTGHSKISGTFKGTILAGYKILWTIFQYKFLKPKLEQIELKKVQRSVPLRRSLIND